MRRPVVLVVGDDHPYRVRHPAHRGEGRNADVVGSYLPTANTEALYPITFGSSHLQAVSFTGGGADVPGVGTLSSRPPQPPTVRGRPPDGVQRPGRRGPMQP
jgi:hypothetical protein